MYDELFKEVCSKLAFTNGHMNYGNFVANFDDPRHIGPAEDIVRPNNHRVNPIRGDEYGVPAVEVEQRLRKKLRENFEVCCVCIHRTGADIEIANLSEYWPYIDKLCQLVKLHCYCHCRIFVVLFINLTMTTMAF